MSQTRVVMQSRVYDQVFDPVYCTSNHGAIEPGGNRVPSTATTVSGPARYQYSRRPVVPQLDAVAPDVLLAPTKQQDPTEAPAVYDEPLIKEVAVQTQYRESEAQTTPYTPEFVIPEETPDIEVDMLQGLKFDSGQPIGRREMEMIENARRKRQLEASLPPGTDACALALRKRLLEAQEMKEFAMRTSEMDHAHQERLDLLQNALLERDAGNEFLAEQRIEALRQRKMEERDVALEAIQAKRIKILRKLTKARAKEPGTGPQNTLNQTSKRDIIGEYADFASEVYAPKTRHGQHPDKQGKKYDVTDKVMPLNSLSGIKELESTLPVRLSHTQVRRPQGIIQQRARNSAERAAVKLTQDLKVMDTILSTRSAALASGQTTGSSTRKVELPAWRTRVSKAERPPTPDVQENRPEDEDLATCLVLLQRLLRGRAVQNTMFEGKERRRELINDLRSADIEEEADAQMRLTEVQEKLRREAEDATAILSVDDSKKDEDEIPADADRAAQVAEASADTMAGQTVANMFDFLAKERMRKDEKDKMMSRMKHAAGDRRDRETAESGRRQAEERVRAREDEVYRQVVRTHYGSASSLVDSVVDSTIESESTGAAMQQLRQDPSVVQSLLAADASEGDTGATDVVASFLAPALEQLDDKQDAAEADVPFIEAAHKTVGDAVESVAMRGSS